MGEHAVVYGRPALVAAVDLRLTVHVSPATDGAVHLSLTGLGHAETLSWEAVRAYARASRESWTEYAREPGPERFRAMRGDDPAHVVKIALGESADFLAEEEAPGVRVAVESELPVGSGFGSSAATAAGVVAGYLAWRSLPLDPDRVEHLALEAERRQHGLPSGVDTAAVVHGGLLWARKTAGGLATETLEPRSSLLSRLRVYDTGTPAEPTGAVVAAVRRRRDEDPGGHERLLDRIEEATWGLRAELSREEEDAVRVRELIREGEACLEELGVVPGPVRELVRRIEAAGGAAKISGAGSLAGPGAGSLLVYHSEAERISGWPFLSPLTAHPVHLGAVGLRLEIDE
jgi:mevalonate kinase